MSSNHIWKITRALIQVTSSLHCLAFPMSLYGEDDILYSEPSPEYRASVTRSNTQTTSTSGSSSVHWASPFSDPRTTKSVPQHLRSHSLAHYSDAVNSVQRRTPQTRPERYVYAYSLHAGSAPLQFMISVEPANGRPTPGRYTFRLSLKVDYVERALGEATTLKLAVDPRKLEFIVFLFPGKNSLPPGTLYSYRVWLRVNGVDHRIFGDDDLWVAKDPDFQAIADASIARLTNIAPNTQTYDGYVGKAHVQFIARWRLISDHLYNYTLEYDANGIGGTLIDDLRLLIHGDPRRLTFLIYTVPMKSLPPGASHRIRIWLKTHLPLSEPISPHSSTPYTLPFVDSFIYQRIWKSDDFKIGAQLDFSALGARMVMGVSQGQPTTVYMPNSLPGISEKKADSKEVLEL